MGSTTTNYAIPYPAVTDYVTDGAQNMEDIAERADAVLGALSNGRNRLINGDFRIAQRGTSFVAGANNDDTYNLDRWTLLSDGNDIVDVTQANVAPTGGLFSIGLDVETANKKFGILQIIEQRNIVGCVGSQCTLSFKFRTSGSSISNVKAVILAWNSTADSVTSDVVSAWNADNTTPTWATNWTAENTPANVNPTNSWQTASITALVDTASTNNIAVFIWCDDLSTTVGDFLYVTDVQFEQGETATKFERRDFTDELIRCQRYYEAQGNLSTTGDYFLVNSVYGTGAAHYLNVFFKVPKRATPTINAFTSPNFVAVDRTFKDGFNAYWTTNGVMYGFTASAEL